MEESKLELAPNRFSSPIITKKSILQMSIGHGSSSKYMRALSLDTTKNPSAGGKSRLLAKKQSNSSANVYRIEKMLSIFEDMEGTRSEECADDGEGEDNEDGDKQESV